MTKDEIRNTLLDFAVEYDPTRWSNQKVFDKFTDVIFDKFSSILLDLNNCQKLYKTALEKLELVADRNQELERAITLACQITNIDYNALMKKANKGVKHVRRNKM